MCGYEREYPYREQEKKRQRNERINRQLLERLQNSTKEQTIKNLFAQLTFLQNSQKTDTAWVF